MLLDCYKYTIIMLVLKWVGSIALTRWCPCSYSDGSMKLSQALRTGNTPALALVGAGGKTTALFLLAKEMVRAIVTTTTHLGAWQLPAECRRIEADLELPNIGLNLGSGITAITGRLDVKTNRYLGLSGQRISELKTFAHGHGLPLLIEADGSHQRPLKAAAPHEPAIPDFSDRVVVVAGLTGLGKPMNGETVHRPEIFACASGLAIGDDITPGALMKLLADPVAGGMKNIPSAARRIVLLNQADTSGLRSQGAIIASTLLDHFHSGVVARLEKKPPKIVAVYERVAGIILAAGSSSRFGRAKQLLEYHGKPFVRTVVETALAAGLSPVVLVRGADADRIDSAVGGLPIQTVHNADWQSGQDSSVRAGISTLITSPGPCGGERGLGGAIFLHADQPLVTVEVVRALMERHAKGLPVILAPVVAGRRADPVLMDRELFPELLTLSGNQGWRPLFSRHPVEFLPWLDDGLLLDVDTPEDYARLMNR
jgi:molybdenum cofactor cytidylyltransferase